MRLLNACPVCQGNCGLAITKAKLPLVYSCCIQMVEIIDSVYMYVDMHICFNFYALYCFLVNVSSLCTHNSCLVKAHDYTTWIVLLGLLQKLDKQWRKSKIDHL